MRFFIVIILLFYYLITGFFTNIFKPEWGVILARKMSYLFRDKGNHKYRNLMIIPPWSVYFAPRNRKKRKPLERYPWNCYELLCFDLKNEPLRHDTIESLLFLCFEDMKDYQSCLNNALKQKKVLGYYKDKYCDDRFKESIKKIDYYIAESTKAIERNCYSKNYNLSFVDDLINLYKEDDSE